MDLNKIAAAALESLGENVRDDLRGRFEEIKNKRDVLEQALGRAREQVLKQLPPDLRAEFKKEDVAFLFFMKIEDEAPDFAHFITDAVREAVEKLIDCERILETFDDEEPAPKARPAAPPPVSRPTARLEPNLQAPQSKIPVTTTAKDADAKRDALIEKIILEVIHLEGKFRNTKEFRAKQDITYEQCVAVLKQLREQEVISLEGTGPHTVYLFKDPQLRPKKKSAVPAEPSPASPAAVVAAPAAAVAEPAPAVALPSAPKGPARSERREELTELMRAIEKGDFSDARRVYENSAGVKGRGRRSSFLVELQRLMDTKVLDLIRTCFDTLNKNSGNTAVTAEQSRRIAELSSIIVAADHHGVGIPREELCNRLMPHIARLPLKVRKEVLDYLKEDDIFDAQSVAEVLKAAEPEQTAELEQKAAPSAQKAGQSGTGDIRHPETGADIAEDFRQAIRAGRFYDAKALYVRNLAKKDALNPIVLGGVRIALDELKSCIGDIRRADRIVGMISESVRLFRSTDIAPGIEDSEFRTIILDASRNLPEAFRRALRAELSGYCPPAPKPISSSLPRAVNNDNAFIEDAILTELRAEDSLSNIAAFAEQNGFTHAACYMVLKQLCAQGVICKRGRGLRASYALADSAPLPIAEASASGAARQPVDPPFVREFLHEVEKGNIPAARVVYEHDSMRQGALNSAVLRYISMRLDWLVSNVSAGKDDIIGQCRAIRHAANAVLKTKDSEYGMPLKHLQGALSGQIAGLPDTMRQKVLAELRYIFSTVPPAPPAPATPAAPEASHQAPRPAPELGPTADQLRDRVADFVYDLRFEDARRVNVNKEYFRQGALMAVTRHLLLVAGTDETSNNHLQSAGAILKTTRYAISSDMTTTALNAAISTMREQPDRYPSRLIFKIKFFLRQYL